MERYLSLNVHTERLHQDDCWQRVKSLINCLEKNNIQATWFVVNPSFVGYKAMGFNERKWKERLRIIKEANQIIEQHTHFYKGKEGVPKGEGYDLSSEHALKRIREDKQWLGEQGFKVKGFLSGAWRINEEVLRVLAEEGYKYDSSFSNLKMAKEITIRKINGLLEIPATGTIKEFFKDLFFFKTEKRFLKYKGIRLYNIHFHDFDLLEAPINYWLLRFLISFPSVFNFKFIALKEFHKKVKSL